MKRIISLALATLLCAAVFVGCGENTVSSSSSKSESTTSSSRSTTSTKASENNILASSSTMSNEKSPTIPSSGGVWLAKPKELSKNWEKRLSSGYSIDIPGQAPDVKTMYISKIDSDTAIVFDTDTEKYVKNVYIQCKKENRVLTERDKSKIDEYVSTFGQTVDPKFTSESLTEVKANMIVAEDGASRVAIKNNTMFQILVQDESRIM